jgi:hypothetical protein
VDGVTWLEASVVLIPVAAVVAMVVAFSRLLRE